MGIPRNFSVYILSVFVLAHLSVYGQYNETILSDRPGQSIGPFSVGKNIFQIQSGIDHYGYDYDASGFGSSGEGDVINTVIRYGILERLEVNGLIDYRRETLRLNANSFGSKREYEGLSAFDIGARVHVLDGRGIIPSLGFQARVRLPMLSEDYQIDNIAPRFVLVTGHKLSQIFNLTTNWGGAWNGNNSIVTSFYVINLSFPIAGKLSGFIENYGDITDGDFNTHFDAGFAFRSNNDLQLDFLGGKGNNDGITDYFASVGFSWRTKKR